jgi:hypothetical protein
MSNNTLFIHNSYPEINVIQLAKSQDGSWVVYSKISNDGNIDLFKMHRDNSDPVQITNTDGIEFDPAIDNNGTVAWAYHSYSVNDSEIYLNNKKIELAAGLYKNCFMFNNMLYFSYVRFYDDVHRLVEVNISTNKMIKQITVPLVIDRISNISNAVILEGFDLLSNNASIYSFDYQNQIISKTHDNAIIYQDKIIYLDNLSDDKIFRLLAERELLYNDPLLSFSASNNYLGRLSWFVSYRLLGLIDAFKNGGLSSTFDRVLIKSIIRNSVKNLVNSAIDASWPTKKYSISRTTELSLLAEEATIGYALLNACNNGIVTNNTSKNVIMLGKELFERNEQEFNNVYGGYKFRRGIDFTYDGVVVPFNYQNIFGLVLLELFRATGEDKYRERATRLATLFKSEFEYTSNNCLIWHYWPNIFYSGWSVLDNISDNTPSRFPEVDNLYEDIGHASWNIAFIFRFMEICGNTVFTSQDISTLQKNLDNIRYGVKYSRFISGDTEYQQPSIMFRPGFSWIKLNDTLLNEQYTHGVPAYGPFFDRGGSFTTLIYLITEK